MGVGAAILRTFRNVLLGIAALAVALSAALLAGPRLAGWIIDMRRPPLGPHLPANVDGAEREFDRRVRARFPLGSPTATLERVLLEEGFGPVHPFKDGRYVRIDRSTGLFEESFIVSWTADGDRLATVRGSYGLTGP